MILGQRMVVCVLKHTPGVFVDYTDENDTIYSGLEVEVPKEQNFIRDRWIISNAITDFRSSVACHRL